MSEANHDSPTAAAPRLPVRTALIVVILQWVLIYSFARWGSTNVQNFIGLALVPVITSLILVGWWLRAKAVPRKDRFGGLALVAVLLALVVLVQPNQGIFMLAYALPVTLTALVLLFAVTFPLAWPPRRWAALLLVFLCAGYFATQRVETIGGNLYPVIAWRWSPDAEARSAALAKEITQGTATLPAAITPSDWPAFRGPNRDNRVLGVQFATDWTATPPKELWRKEVGPAWSSFALVGDYLFTQEQRGEEEFVTCHEASTGKEVWSNRVSARFEDAMGLGPRATPAYDRGKLFAVGATGTFQCLDAATGSVLWTQDLSGDGGKDFPLYGFASSPLVVGDLVMVYACGAGKKLLTAYDIATGTEAWTAAADTRGYSSPQLSVIDGQPQVLLAHSKGLQSFAPASGAMLWAHDWPYNTYPRCTQPAVSEDGLVLVGTSGETGARYIDVSYTDDTWQAKEAWTNNKFRPYFNDGVYHEGHFYGFDGNRLNCIDLKTGEAKWQGSRYGGQIIVIADMDLLLILGEKGEVALVSATPDAFTEVSTFKVLTGKTWNHPVVRDGRLYVRNSAEMACFELPGATTSAG